MLGEKLYKLRVLVKESSRQLFTSNCKHRDAGVTAGIFIKINVMYKINNNVEDKVIGEFEDDLSFIEFVEKIVIENEDYNFSVLGVSDAIEYIEDYCSDLELIY
jgi:hypothetical protein